MRLNIREINLNKMFGKRLRDKLIKKYTFYEKIVVLELMRFPSLTLLAKYS